MALRTFVKVGNITNLTDARYCAGMGVDLLGFQVIENQLNYIAPKAFQEIRGWVAGPLVVAEIYGLPNVEMLTSILENYRPDYIELGVQELKIIKDKPGVPIILAVNEGEEVPEWVKPAWVIRQATTGQHQGYLLAITSLQQAITALATPSVKGLALTGSIETRPGIKEYNSLSETLEMLEVEG